jgi:hypothetical protein
VTSAGSNLNRASPSPIIDDPRSADEWRPCVAAAVLLGVSFTWRRPSVERKDWEVVMLTRSAFPWFESYQAASASL